MIANRVCGVFIGHENDAVTLERGHGGPGYRKNLLIKIRSITCWCKIAVPAYTDLNYVWERDNVHSIIMIIRCQSCIQQYPLGTQNRIGFLRQQGVVWRPPVSKKCA